MWKRISVLWLLSAGVAGACSGGESGVEGTDTGGFGLRADLNASDSPGQDSSDVITGDTGDGLGAPEVTCLLTKTWTEAPVGKLDCLELAYDKRGNPIMNASDQECDGVAERCWRREWDELGRITGSYTDKDCDNTVDYLCNWSIYDDEASSVTTLEDNDCDGSADFERVFVFDEAGNVLSESVTEDPLLGGKFTYCYYQKYDDFGNRLERRFDENCDGSGEWCEVEAFDADGNPTTSHADDGCDGIPDRNCRTYEFTPLGDGVVRQVQRLDHLCDGKDVTCWTRDVSSQGFEIGRKQDSGCDGQVEWCESKQFDAIGSLLQRTWEEPCGSVPKVCGDLIILNAQGLVLQSQSDLGCSGKPWDCATFVYDEAGKLIESSSDPTCIGAYGEHLIYEYDVYGNEILRSTQSESGNGYFRAYHSEYSCQ